MAKNDNARIVLGNKAQALAVEVADGDEAVNATHLEVGIAKLQQEIEQLKGAGEANQREAVLPPLKKLIQAETDQLHHELTMVLAAQNKEVVNLLNGVRFMLNTFAEDIAGADVEELIKATNDWLDQTVKPIAATRAESEKPRAADGRPENENDTGRDHETASSQVNQPVVPQEEKQEELPFQNAQQERDEYER